jgi:predicted ATPase
MERKAAKTAPAGAMGTGMRALTSGVWQVQLLGGLRARNGEVWVQRFSPRAVACLLARLALDPGRDHAREELADLLWPQRDGKPLLTPAVLQNRLRNALSVLNGLLKAPVYEVTPVMLSDRLHVRAVPGKLLSDAQQFEVLARQARDDPKAALQARELYRGELMPGHYDEWVLERRAHLAALFDRLPPPARPPANPGLQRQRPQPRPTVLSLPPQASHLAQPPLRRLPNYLNSFVGRGDDLRRLSQALKKSRLLCLVGAGGCGKTRLSVQWASQAPGFDSVVFVPLQDCGTASEVMNHVRAALDVQAADRQRPVIEQIEDRLRGHRALLILDCCEHLMDPGIAPAAQPAASRRAVAGSQGPRVGRGTLFGQLQALLRLVPGLSMLLTSRKTAGLNATNVALKPLPVPPPDALAQEAWSMDSVALFIDRARMRRSDVDLHARNVSSVIELCSRLDGLPVFIEIAASQVRKFSPAAMCRELAKSPAPLTLTGHAARRAGRHVSGQALLQWSWRLLSPPLQAMWAAVAAFRSGWTLAAAADVAQCTLAQARKRLQALVDHSLVQLELGPGGQARWTMLGVVRDLVQSWVPAEQAHNHHQRMSEHFVAWAQSLQARHAAFGNAESANVEGVLEAAVASGEVDAAVSLCLALQWPWVAVGPSVRTVQWVQQLARQVSAEQAAAFHSLRVRLLMLHGHGREALQAGQLALKCAGLRPEARADALLAVTNAKWRGLGDGAAVLGDARQALELAQRAGDPELQARSAVLLGAITLMHLDDPASARALFLRARTLFVQMDNEAGALSVEPGLTTCLSKEGKHLRAMHRAKRTLARARQLDLVELQLLILNRLGNCAESLERFADVVRINQQQLKLARQHASLYHQGFAVWNLCLPLMRLHQPEKALRLMGFAERLWTEHYGDIDADGQANMQTLRGLGDLALGRALCRRLWREGAALTLAQGLSLADS